MRRRLSSSTRLSGQESVRNVYANQESILRSGEFLEKMLLYYLVNNNRLIEHIPLKFHEKRAVPGEAG